MLQKTDEDRRSAVLKILEERKIRFPVADIHKATGIDKGMISNYLNGKKPISDKFYSTFMEKFGNQKGGGSLSVSDFATLQVRSEAMLTVLLEAIAEMLAGQKGLTSAEVRLSLESAVKTKEAILREEYGEK